MIERPILFSGPMVKALLEGRKTQTRRVITAQPASGVRYSPGGGAVEDGHGRPIRPRYGVPPDRLWVRETWRGHCGAVVSGGYELGVAYAAGGFRSQIRVDLAAYNAYIGDSDPSHPWRPSIFMPRWASRITLEITEVRVQQLQAISPGDIAAEGMAVPVTPEGHILIELAAGVVEHLPPGRTEPFTVEEIARAYFARGWDAINGRRGYSWHTNPFVWAISFRRIA